MLDLYEFKRHHALRGSDIVNTLHRHYPKFNKTTESLASHYDESGICLTSDAEAILCTRFDSNLYRKGKTPPDTRIQIRTRVTDDLHERFRAQLKRNGTTAQHIITMLVEEWVDAQEFAERKMANEQM